MRNAISFIQTNIIAEKVLKQNDRIEATRFYNFPLIAIEESLSNAVYHKSYERQSPIEIQIWQDKIEILSFPGPVPPVDKKVLKAERRIVSREYRNRRIGDFLKELELTEGRGTGFPAIYDALEANGSPKPIFKTDNECSYFLTVIEAHPLTDKTYPKSTNPENKPLFFSNIEDIIRFANDNTNQIDNRTSDRKNKNNTTKQTNNQRIKEQPNQVSDQVNHNSTDRSNNQTKVQKASNQPTNNQDSNITNGVTNGATNGATGQIEDILNKKIHSRVTEVLMLLQERLTRAALFEKMRITNQSYNRKKYLDPLFSLGWIEIEFPDKITSPKQTYKITPSGKRILWLLEKNKN